MNFLTTKGIGAEIEKIIRNADQEIKIITPYIQIGDLYIERLADAEKRNVKITFVFREQDNLSEQDESKLLYLKNTEIYFMNNLHAKCYMNEKTALITSMNLYNYSEKNNREMGITINKYENFDIYIDINKEVDSIINNAEKYYTSYKKSSYDYHDKKTSNNFKNENLHYFQKDCHKTGYCIRCGQEIDYDPTHPLCFDCYKVWAEYQNPDYQETFCHSCGKQIDDWTRNDRISYMEPLCNYCKY